MSPRSEEFLASARGRLRAARAALGAGHPSVAVGAAYDAVLYAARAAPSEEDRNATTHRGVWALFAERLVATGRLGPELLAGARRAQELREAADYDAREVSGDEAEAVVGEAERFVAGVAALLGP